MNANLDRSMKLFEEYGIDVEQKLKELSQIPISMHCWQGDDVGGFEHFGSTLSGGGIQVTRQLPGKARTPMNFEVTCEKALSLIPGNIGLISMRFMAISQKDSRTGMK